MEKKTLGVIAFAMFTVLAFGAVSAFGGFGNNMSEEDREAMDTVMESGDFEAWKSLMQSQLTEERFNEMRARNQERAEFRDLMQEARESGNYSKIQELKSEFGQGKGMHKQNMNPGECPFAE